MTDNQTETPASTGAVSEPHHSYTSLNTYLNICQLQYFYRYVEKAPSERTAVFTVTSDCAELQFDRRAYRW